MGAPKSDAATIAARRARLLELLADGSGPEDLVAELEGEGFPASRLTLWRDVKALQTEWKEANAEAFDALRKAQLRVLQLMEDAVLSGSLAPELVREWRAVRADIAKLLGLNSETDGPAFQLNLNGGGKGPRRAVVELVAPPPRPAPQRGTGPSSPDYIDVEPEPLLLGAGAPDAEERQRAEARAELRKKVGLR